MKKTVRLNAGDRLYRKTGFSQTSLYVHLVTRTTEKRAYINQTEYVPIEALVDGERLMGRKAASGCRVYLLPETPELKAQFELQIQSKKLETHIYNLLGREASHKISILSPTHIKRVIVALAMHDSAAKVLNETGRLSSAIGASDEEKASEEALLDAVVRRAKVNLSR